MSKDGSWEDALTLQAISHLLLREIRIVTDYPNAADALMFVESPSAIPPAAWGEPFYLVRYAERHYEATQVAGPTMDGLEVTSLPSVEQELRSELKKEKHSS